MLNAHNFYDNHSYMFYQKFRQPFFTSCSGFMAIEHLLNLRGVHGAVLAERSDSKNRDIAESG
jgi:hypothetical protein